LHANFHYGGSLNSSQKTGDYHYDREALKSALIEVGLKRSSLVFSHVGMGFLGYPKEGKDLGTMFEVLYDSFIEILGPDGTWLIPTYTYSFCRGESFDVQNSPSTVGYFTEQFRKLPNAIRSVEPLFSVAGIGPKVDEIFNNLPMNSFGKDSIYDRLVKEDAYICNIGVGTRYATFVHYVEQLIGVPYRYRKVFTGDIINGREISREVSIVYYVRTSIDDETTFPDLSRLEDEARRLGKCKSKRVGRGEVTLISCRDMLDLCIRGVKRDPWYLARGARKTSDSVLDKS